MISFSLSLLLPLRIPPAHLRLSRDRRRELRDADEVDRVDLRDDRRLRLRRVRRHRARHLPGPQGTGRALPRNQEVMGSNLAQQLLGLFLFLSSLCFILQTGSLQRFKTGATRKVISLKLRGLSDSRTFLVRTFLVAPQNYWLSNARYV